MVAVEAVDHGEFTTVSVIPPIGGSLWVNARTGRTGYVKVSVKGDEQRGEEWAIPLVGDLHWAEVRWRDVAGLGLETGQAVTLRVELRQARLWGLEFRE